MMEKRLALLLAAALAPAAFPAATDTLSITGKASGLRFTGNFDDEAGRRSWLAEADSAASGAKPGEWRLERIRITTFDQRNGKIRLRIVAPAATYFDKENTAADPGPVVMDGGDDGGAIRLTGRDWRWTDLRNAGYTFAIHDAVRVALTPVAKTGSHPTVITADRLDATNTRDERRLVLAGRVRIESKDTAGKLVVMTCDHLVVHLPASKSAPGTSGRAGIFDSIEATGNVDLEDRGAHITGDKGLVLPGPAGKAVYTVSGDALFTANGAADLRVNGETMRFDSATRSIGVDPPADAADGRVTARFRSPGAPGKGVSGDAARATASGKKLVIRIGDDAGTLLFDGDVRLDDPGYTGTCGRLAVDFRFDHKKRMPAFGAENAAVRHVVAEDAVSLTFKDPGHTGRTVTAGRAEFFPERGRTVLTVRPQARDPENGLVLDAAKVTIENDRDADTGRIVAESDAATPVRAAFDATGTTDSARLARLPPRMTVVSALFVGRSGRAPGAPNTRVGNFRFEGGVKLDGEGVSGECDRLGLEVSAPPVASGRASARIRHAVATGNVRLDFTGKGKTGNFTAKAGRAEIWPEANMRELAPSAADALDGPTPLYVTLERDESTPGLRPVVTVSGFAGSVIAGGLSPEKKDKTGGATVVEADHEELIAGDKRIRAFARNNVVFTAADAGVSGTSATLEMLATAKPPETGGPGSKKDPVFSPDAIIARERVKLAIESTQRTIHASADTLEIFPGPDGSGTLALDGKPVVDAMITPPEVTRKVFRWTRVPGAGGKPNIAYQYHDEIVRGETRQILRPRITLPPDRAPDIATPVGGAVKNLDNAR